MDYPPRALRERMEGSVGFQLEVGANGRATDCTITQSSGYAVLDERTCRSLMRRARFIPALDDEGYPTAGRYVSSVRWTIPRDPVPSDFAVRLAWTINAQGETEDCEILEVRGSPPEEFAELGNCAGVERDLYEIPRDAAGNAVSKRVTVTFETRVEDLES